MAIKYGNNPALLGIVTTDTSLYIGMWDGSLYLNPSVYSANVGPVVKYFAKGSAYISRDVSNLYFYDVSAGLKSLSSWVSKSGDTMTGNLTVPSLISTGGITSTSASIGQSTMRFGLVVNNDASSSTISDFVVKTLNYNAIDVSAGINALMLMNSNLGKIGFFGSTPSVQSTGWSATNGLAGKTIDIANMNLNQLADLVASLINELKSKGLIG